MTAAVAVTRSQIRSLAPHANDVYLAAFELADSILPRYAITTPLRISHFISQLMHESGGLTILVESLNYTHPERIMAVWPSRFPSLASALPYVRNPVKLAEKVYGNRLGNYETGDGYRYIGRGLLQLTGRNNYRHYGHAVGAELEQNPDLAADARFVLPIAAAEWQSSGCNAFAEADDVVRVTRAINGALIGLDERREWLRKTKAIWMPTATAS